MCFQNRKNILAIRKLFYPVDVSTQISMTSINYDYFLTFDY